MPRTVVNNDYSVLKPCALNFAYLRILIPVGYQTVVLEAFSLNLLIIFVKNFITFFISFCFVSSTFWRTIFNYCFYSHPSASIGILKLPYFSRVLLSLKSNFLKTFFLYPKDTASYWITCYSTPFLIYRSTFLDISQPTEANELNFTQKCYKTIFRNNRILHKKKNKREEWT